ncbi:hypothetical protein BP00DRAFT_244467 [Aspergillus indologenus CBS 114.80]|uniref:Uncharacterized protein n=1 Tax=Aspergillus indologenus CBS 114.80 TaxID=1450541 RepID=A0A2V5I575_9EURO|nr:hypothetical protein BP00DRAFT_244467 [Aspergillus indologenus CBS 114.80]
MIARTRIYGAVLPSVSTEQPPCLGFKGLKHTVLHTYCTSYIIISCYQCCGGVRSLGSLLSPSKFTGRSQWLPKRADRRATIQESDAPCVGPYYSYVTIQESVRYSHVTILPQSINSPGHVKSQFAVYLESHNPGQHTKVHAGTNVEPDYAYIHQSHPKIYRFISSQVCPKISASAVLLCYVECQIPLV